MSLSAGHAALDLVATTGYLQLRVAWINKRLRFSSRSIAVQMPAPGPEPKKGRRSELELSLAGGSICKRVGSICMRTLVLAALVSASWASTSRATDLVASQSPIRLDTPLSWQTCAGRTRITTREPHVLWLPPIACAYLARRKFKRLTCATAMIFPVATNSSRAILPSARFRLR
jgi:hypothetical protein